MDLTDRRFGRLTVLHRGRRAGHRVYWRVRCVCGVVKEVRADALRTNGGTRSCGCLQREAAKAQGHHHQPGERFGRLRIIRQAGTVKRHGRSYLCRCDCGRTTKVRGDQLRDGTTRSCGCFYSDTRTTANLRHGQSRAKSTTGAYLAYTRQRGWCRNPRDRRACYFRALGVEFRFETFAAFYAEVGPKPSADHWLLRIDLDGHFEAGNLHWVLRPRKHKRKRRLK
jgi:Staphylococcus phage HNH endonuclease